MTHLRSLLLATAFSAALACAPAGAASFEGTAAIGKLSFKSTDLITGSTITNGFSFNDDAASFVGSLTSLGVLSSEAGSASGSPTFVASATPYNLGDYGAPFDTMQTPAGVSDHGQTASVSVQLNLISATVTTSAVSGYFGYAEGNVAALTLAGGRPSLTQNTLLVAAHTEVTVSAWADVWANLVDADACPNCAGQFTGFAALVGGNKLAAYIDASQGESSLRMAALQVAEISFVALDGVQLNDSTQSASAGGALSLTFTNDTDSVQGFGFLAGAWINGNSNPGSTSPVPEPATAGMALAGLLLIGRTLRRRQRG